MPRLGCLSNFSLPSLPSPLLCGSVQRLQAARTLPPVCPPLSHLRQLAAVQCLGQVLLKHYHRSRLSRRRRLLQPLLGGVPSAGCRKGRSRLEREGEANVCNARQECCSQRPFPATACIRPSRRTPAGACKIRAAARQRHHSLQRLQSICRAGGQHCQSADLSPKVHA